MVARTSCNSCCKPTGNHPTSPSRGPGSTTIHQQNADQAVPSPPDDGPGPRRSDLNPNTHMHRLQDPQSAEIVQEWQQYLAGQKPEGASAGHRFA